MNKLVEKELNGDLKADIADQRIQDFEKRQKEFLVELNLLKEKLAVDIVPLISPQGPVIQLINLKQ